MNEKRKFWTFTNKKDEGGNDTDERELRIDGVIAEEESWFYDTVTADAFRDELKKGSGDITLWIHSIGGDVFAAAQIYNALCAYKYKVTVKVDALAASAASVVAMAGDVVEISPLGEFMIHNPWTMCIGEAKDMQKTLEALEACKDNILNAYQLKTKMSRQKLSALMDAEKWISAREAVELGFADKIIGGIDISTLPSNRLFSQREYMGRLVAKMRGNVTETRQAETRRTQAEAPRGVDVSQLYKRLDLIK